MTTADAILRTLESPNIFYDKRENANIVDVIDNLSCATKRVANAITANVAGGTDEAGGHVESLTEAVMGMTKGLVMIASSIDSLADAVREHDFSE